MEKSFGQMPKKTWMDNYKGSGSCALDLAKQSGLLQEVLHKDRQMFGVWIDFVFSRRPKMNITIMMTRNEIFQYQSHDYSYLYGKYKRISNG